MGMVGIRYGRIALGCGIVLGLALIAGLDTSIEAKPPPLSTITLKDLDLPAARERIAPARSAPVPEMQREFPRISATVRPDRISLPSAAPTSGNSMAGRFELTGAEKLSIKFHGYQDLSGDYRVNPDETLSIPALGRVSIGGLTAAELEVALAEKAARITGRESYITVEVAEYRPVFVSGLVSRPGSHAWQPGMTVLHAVTLLGGIYRATAETGGGLVIGADAEVLRLRRSINELKRSLALLARLRTERSELGAIAVPEELAALVGKAEAQALIAEQSSVLANRRASLSAQLAALERAKTVANQEMAGLTAQGQRLREVLEQRRTYKKSIDGLQAKGYVRAERSMDEQSRLVDLEDRATTVSVGIARVQGTIAGLDRDMITLRQERRADIDQEIFRLSKENAQAELEIEAARSAYFKITGAPAPMSFGDKEAPKAMVVEYQVVRHEGGVQTSVKADQFTRLKPGDIVIVEIPKD